MLKKGIVMQCTNKNYSGEINYQGDRVTVKCQDQIKDLFIGQRKFFAFKVDDVARVQCNEDLLKAHLSNANNIIESVQEEYLLKYHDYVLPENSIGNETNSITLTKDNIYEKFVQLAICLKNSAVDSQDKTPWVIINPVIESILLQTPEFITNRNIADTTLREGATGRLAGMDVLVSTNLTAVDDKYYILAGTNDAITFASQLAKIESLRDKDSFSDLVRGLYLYDAKVVEPKSLAKLIVKAS